MATTKIYLTAGLPVAKDSGQSPSAGESTIYMTAGPPPDVEVAVGGAPKFLPEDIGLKSVNVLSGAA